MLLLRQNKSSESKEIWNKDSNNNKIINLLGKLYTLVSSVGMNNMSKYKQAFLVLSALTLGVTSFTAGAKAKPTVYQNGDRQIYIFHPKDQHNNQSSTRTRYNGPKVDYYRGPVRTRYNGPKVNYYRGPRGSVVKGPNRTYVKPNR